MEFAIYEVDKATKKIKRKFMKFSNVSQVIEFDVLNFIDVLSARTNRCYALTFNKRIVYSPLE